MPKEKNYYFKSRVRAKGQVTIPPKIREVLGAEPGDNLIFHVKGERVIIEREKTIDAEQAWFWSERWQKMEREAEEDIRAGHVHRYSNVEDAIEELESGDDAGN